MNSKLNVTPHRPKRDKQRARELAELKKENTKLQRAVKRLEKEINKRVEVEGDAAEEGLEESLADTEVVETCKACNTGILQTLILANKVFSVCPECKWRAKIGEQG